MKEPFPIIPVCGGAFLCFLVLRIGLLEICDVCEIIGKPLALHKRSDPEDKCKADECSSTFEPPAVEGRRGASRSVCRVRLRTHSLLLFLFTVFTVLTRPRSVQVLTCLNIIQVSRSWKSGFLSFLCFEFRVSSPVLRSSFLPLLLCPLVFLFFLLLIFMFLVYVFFLHLEILSHFGCYSSSLFPSASSSSFYS